MHRIGQLALLQQHVGANARGHGVPRVERESALAETQRAGRVVLLDAELSEGGQRIDVRRVRAKRLHQELQALGALACTRARACARYEPEGDERGADTLEFPRANTPTPVRRAHHLPQAVSPRETTEAADVRAHHSPSTAPAPRSPPPPHTHHRH